MKNLFFLVVFFITTALTFAQSQVWVSGYTRSSGTYVRGHYRTVRDHTINNNWSTVGNVNPHTGKAGTISRSSYYGSSSYSAPSYSSSYSSRYSSPSSYSTSSYSTPSYSSRYSNTIYTGPRGGQYYINSNGNKSYIRR